METAWDDNHRRVLAYVETPDRVPNRTGQRAVIVSFSRQRTVLARRGRAIDAGLRRLGGGSCELLPTKVTPTLTLPDLPPRAGRQPAERGPDSGCAGPTAQSEPRPADEPRDAVGPEVRSGSARGLRRALSRLVGGLDGRWRLKIRHCLRATTDQELLVPTVIAPPLRLPLVLADAIPGARARDGALIAAGAGLTALLAQISIPVPPSPVPVTGQTLAVVLVGASLGARRGAAAMTLYVLLGLFLPVYAEGGSGPDVIWGASGGYLVGFVLAAGAVGWCAERGADRRLPLAVATFILGQLLVFGIGVPWLKVAADMTWARAIHDGFSIFIVGGLIKALAAGALTPTVWRLVRRTEGRD